MSIAPEDGRAPGFGNAPSRCNHFQSTLTPPDASGKVLRMKCLPLIIGSCCILAAGCTSPTVSTPASSSAAQLQAANDTLVAGTYSGDWSNSDGITGTVRLTLTKPDNSPWQASVTFNYNGNDVATTLESIKVNGPQIWLTYDYDMQGHAGTVVMTGKLAGNILQGSFEIAKGDASPGTWQATRIP